MAAGSGLAATTIAASKKNEICDSILKRHFAFLKCPIYEEILTRLPTVNHLLCINHVFSRGKWDELYRYGMCHFWLHGCTWSCANNNLLET